MYCSYSGKRWTTCPPCIKVLGVATNVVGVVTMSKGWMGFTEWKENIAPKLREELPQNPWGVYDRWEENETTARKNEVEHALRFFIASLLSGENLAEMRIIEQLGEIYRGIKRSGLSEEEIQLIIDEERAIALEPGNEEQSDIKSLFSNVVPLPERRAPEGARQKIRIVDWMNPADMPRYLASQSAKTRALQQVRLMSDEELAEAERLRKAHAV